MKQSVEVKSKDRESWECQPVNKEEERP